VVVVKDESIESMYCCVVYGYADGCVEGSGRGGKIFVVSVTTGNQVLNVRVVGYIADEDGMHLSRRGGGEDEGDALGVD
jgi:hypothetical protein